MRLGKRILRKRTNREVSAKRETRDAVIWDVDTSNRYCRVKVQGSNQLIVAHYNFNWGTKPEWIKPGNPVKINHQGGIRGKIEVIGHGQLIPSPISGGSSPTIATPGDAILTGLLAREISGNDSLRVQVDVGTYRIDGTTYSASSMTMSATSDATMGDEIVMGETTEVIELDAAPAVGNFRIDLISIGVDGVVDYTAGVVASTDPVEPGAAASHVKIAHILVHGGMTVVTSAFINAKWFAPFLYTATATVSDTDLDWMSESTSEIVLYTFDQYGNPYSRSTALGGQTFNLNIIHGNGTLSDTSIYTGGSSASFTYTRGNVAGDISPVFEGTVDSDYVIPVLTDMNISLYDNVGDLM